MIFQPIALMVDSNVKASLVGIGRDAVFTYPVGRTGLELSGALCRLKCRECNHAVS
jgi:hypothetical protein